MPGCLVEVGNRGHLRYTCPMVKACSDEVLMERYRDGDIASFKALYKRYSGRLYQFIFWHSPRKDWVDEIAQDAWTSLHGARHRYQGHLNFRTHLYQIARNRLIDLLRQHQDLLGGEADASVSEQRGPLHAAILGLPGEQREALVLQQFNGFSPEEIAQMTGVPVETVKNRLFYAMRNLLQQQDGAAAHGTDT